MKNSKLPSIVVLFILSMITLLFWTSFSIYRVFTAKPATQVSNDVILKVDPRLDTVTLDQIEKRIYP